MSPNDSFSIKTHGLNHAIQCHRPTFPQLTSRKTSCYSARLGAQNLPCAGIFNRGVGSRDAPGNTDEYVTSGSTSNPHNSRCGWDRSGSITTIHVVPTSSKSAQICRCLGHRLVLDGCPESVIPVGPGDRRLHAVVNPSSNPRTRVLISDCHNNSVSVPGESRPEFGAFDESGPILVPAMS